MLFACTLSKKLKILLINFTPFLGVYKSYMNKNLKTFYQKIYMYIVFYLEAYFSLNIYNLVFILFNNCYIFFKP